MIEFSFSNLSSEITHACYTGFILNGTVSINLGEVKSATIDGKGLLVEIVGEEIVLEKSTGKTTTKDIFIERTPRAILTLKENSYFQNVEIEITEDTELMFEILIPSRASSSFKGEYENYTVTLMYYLKASANINNEKIISTKPIYLANYPFGSIDWFTPNEEKISKTISVKTQETITKTKCFCMKRKITKEQMKDVEISLVYKPVINVDEILNCKVKFIDQGEDPVVNLSLVEIIVIKTQTPSEKIVRVIEKKRIPFKNEEQEFTFNTNELERYDFSYLGQIFDRCYCLLFEYLRMDTKYEIAADLTILSANNYKIAENIKQEVLEEKNVYTLLEVVNFENEKIY